MGKRTIKIIVMLSGIRVPLRGYLTPNVSQTFSVRQIRHCKKV
jgi:hypothetical protein